jgi:hypothetical protein
MTTLKAFANSSPRLERSDNLGECKQQKDRTLKGFGNWRTLSGLNSFLYGAPMVVAYAPTMGWN